MSEERRLQNLGLSHLQDRPKELREAVRKNLEEYRRRGLKFELPEERERRLQNSRLN